MGFLLRRRRVIIFEYRQRKEGLDIDRMLNKSRIERRESISFNSMAVDEYEQHRTIYTVKLMLLGAKCTLSLYRSGWQISHARILHP